MRWLPQVGSGSNQSKARQRGNMRKKSPVLYEWSKRPDTLQPIAPSLLFQAPFLRAPFSLVEELCRPSMRKRCGRYPVGSRKGSLHHCQDACGCERQFIQLDSGIHQALRARAGLECSEVKRISRRFQYFMSKICGGQVEAPGVRSCFCFCFQ